MSKKGCRLNKINVVIFLIVSLLVFNPVCNFAAEKPGQEHNDDFDAGYMILHHIVDSHYWEFWHGATVYFPVILYSEKEGFKFFPTSAPFFNDHLEPVEYQGYKVDHGKILHVDGTADVYDFSITKNVASIFMSIIILFIVFKAVANKYKNPHHRPKGIQRVFEPIIVFLRDEVAKPNIGPKYERFMPFLLTLFFFIWFNNVLGLLPGAANVTGNLAVTGVLALFTFIVTQINGTNHYWKHVFDTPGVPWWLKYPLPIMPMVEFIGLFTKPFSLTVRLFANITAGHIILLSLFSLIFIARSWFVGVGSVLFVVFMTFLELFVALLQAFIFTILSAMYFGSAVEEHHADEEEETDKALI